MILAFGVYRLARLGKGEEEGPFGIFHKVHELIDPEQKTWVGRGVRCPMCIGFWLSLVFALALPFSGGEQYILCVLGLAGLAAALERLIG